MRGKEKRGSEWKPQQLGVGHAAQVIAAGAVVTAAGDFIGCGLRCDV